MADFCDKLAVPRETQNDLANRWFQPLTHVSAARSPRETANARQQAMREKRGLRGSSWHKARHNLFGGCSGSELNPGAPSPENATLPVLRRLSVDTRRTDTAQGGVCCYAVHGARFMVDRGAMFMGRSA